MHFLVGQKLYFDEILFPRVQFTINHHWFRWMAWRWTSDKPSSEQMMAWVTYESLSLRVHILVSVLFIWGAPFPHRMHHKYECPTWPPEKLFPLESIASQPWQILTKWITFTRTHTPFSLCKTHLKTLLFLLFVRLLYNEDERDASNIISLYNLWCRGY